MWDVTGKVLAQVQTHDEYGSHSNRNDYICKGRCQAVEDSSGFVEPTPVTFKYLYNLSRLEIPKIYLHVFASADNMLASGSEVCEYTVCTVRMSRICLHAFRCLRIPATDGRILSASKNES